MPIRTAKGPASGGHPGSGEAGLCSQKHLAESPGGAGESTKHPQPDGRGEEQGGRCSAISCVDDGGEAKYKNAKNMNQFKKCE